MNRFGRSVRDRRVVSITSLGGRGPLYPRAGLPPRRRGPGIGGALAVGLVVFFAWAVVSLFVHLIAATLLWLPAILAAGYAAGLLRRGGLRGLPRLVVAVIVLVAVHAGIVALLHAI